MRILQYIFSIFLFVGTSFAETINIDWMDGSTTYAQTTCTVGGDVILPATPTKRGYTFAGWCMYKKYSDGIVLPCEYDRLEYIESTGTQYIDTGVKIDTVTTRYETKITPLDINTTQAVFGSRNVENTTDKSACTMFIYKKSLRLDLASGVSEEALIPATVDTEYVISVTRGTAIVNGRYYTFADKTQIYQNNNFLIGNLTNGSFETYPQGFIGRTYYGKLYSNGYLLRDFIPVRRISDGEIGMYDTVSETFFGNAGTGEFIAGPVVDALNE